MSRSPGNWRYETMTRSWSLRIATVLAGCFLASCGYKAATARESPAQHSRATPREKVIAGALVQTTYTFGYDPSYVKIAYPMGDVPRDRGVCSDVIVRAFREAGIDLQQEVHEDMKKQFSAYPRKWRARGPDSNIDHRRVLNLMTYFERRGKAQPVSGRSEDYLPGDVVAWDLGNNLEHIGVVADVKSDSSRNLLVVHNVGLGARLEDVMFSWRVIGHYRWFE